MPLGTLVAGRYSCTYGGVDVGFSRQGFELSFQFKQEAIDESDLYGLCTTDLVLRGCDVQLSAALREYKAGSLACLWPLGGGTLGRIASAAVPIGSLATNLAAAMVLTATANTPAAASPASLTAALAFPAPNYNPRILFDSRLREVPIQMHFFPSVASGNLSAFSTT
jgi:hypothetical protein